MEVLFYFNPRSLAGATIRCGLCGHTYVDFNPRSLAGATPTAKADKLACGISIHAPLRERRINRLNSISTIRFQSTLPCGSDTISIITILSTSISIHAPLRERRAITFESARYVAISIHAPLRERHNLPLCSCLLLRFQSTLPCGSDIWQSRNLSLVLKFQSTLPCGSDDSCAYVARYVTISIHAPLRERL